MEVEFKEKKNLLWLWILIGVLVVVIAGGSVYAVGAGKLDWIKAKLGGRTASSGTNLTSANLTLSQTPPSGWQTFTNSKYRFSFKFPDGWQNQAFVGKTEDDGSGYPDYIFTTNNSDPAQAKKIGILLYEKYYSTYSTDSTTTFSDWADANAGNCSADAPCAHANCQTLKQKTPITTESGLSGFKYFVIRKVESNIDGSEKDDNGNACTTGTTEKEYGPIYELNVFDKTAGQLKLIRISPEILDSNTEAVSDDVWEAIANSLKFY